VKAKVADDMLSPRRGLSLSEPVANGPPAIFLGSLQRDVRALATATASIKTNTCMGAPKAVSMWDASADVVNANLAGAVLLAKTGDKVWAVRSDPNGQLFLDAQGVACLSVGRDLMLTLTEAKALVGSFMPQVTGPGRTVYGSEARVEVTTRAGIEQDVEHFTVTIEGLFAEKRVAPPSGIDAALAMTWTQCTAQEAGIDQALVAQLLRTHAAVAVQLPRDSPLLAIMEVTIGDEQSPTTSGSVTVGALSEFICALAGMSESAAAVALALGTQLTLTAGIAGAAPLTHGLDAMTPIYHAASMELHRWREAAGEAMWSAMVLEVVKRTKGVGPGTRALSNSARLAGTFTRQAMAESTPQPVPGGVGPAHGGFGPATHGPGPAVYSPPSQVGLPERGGYSPGSEARVLALEHELQRVRSDARARSGALFSPATQSPPPERPRQRQRTGGGTAPYVSIFDVQFVPEAAAAVTDGSIGAALGGASTADVLAKAAGRPGTGAILAGSDFDYEQDMREDFKTLTSLPGMASWVPDETRPRDQAEAVSRMRHFQRRLGATQQAATAGLSADRARLAHLGDKPRFAEKQRAIGTEMAAQLVSRPAHALESHATPLTDPLEESQRLIGAHGLPLHAFLTSSAKTVVRMNQTMGADGKPLDLYIPASFQRAHDANRGWCVRKCGEAIGVFGLQLGGEPLLAEVELFAHELLMGYVSSVAAVRLLAAKPARKEAISWTALGYTGSECDMARGRMGHAPGHAGFREDLNIAMVQLELIVAELHGRAFGAELDAFGRRFGLAKVADDRAASELSLMARSESFLDTEVVTMIDFAFTQFAHSLATLRAARPPAENEPLLERVSLVSHFSTGSEQMVGDMSADARMRRVTQQSAGTLAKIQSDIASLQAGLAASKAQQPSKPSKWGTAAPAPAPSPAPAPAPALVPAVVPSPAAAPAPTAAATPPGAPKPALLAQLPPSAPPHPPQQAGGSKHPLIDSTAPGTTLATLMLPADSVARDTDAVLVFKRMNAVLQGADPYAFPPPPDHPCPWEYMMVDGCKGRPKGSCKQCLKESTWLPSPAGLVPAIRAAATAYQRLRMKQLP
jgi:hypothetical protein